MPWKDSKVEMIVDDDDTDYPEPGGGRDGGWGVIGYAVLGVGILVLSGVILYLFLGQSMSEDSDRLRNLSDRLAALEDRITTLETVNRGDDALAQQSRRVALYMDRFEKLEATTAKRLSEMTDRLDALAAGARPPAPSSAPSPAPVATAPATPSAKADAKTHVVAKGDTLYSISRKYGLSVEDLLKLNGMPTGAVIHPGDALRVGSGPR